MERTQTETIADKISTGVKSAISELEELRVQLALGKLEAKDLYESNKKKLQAVIHDLENQIRNLKQEPGVLTILNGMEHLKLQLALGKAESKELFEEHYSKISAALHDLDIDLKKNTTLSEDYAKIHLEIAKFKIKMELFALHFKLKKLSIEYDFDQIKSLMSSKLEHFKNQVNNKSKEGKAQWGNFQEEVKDVFDHLKAAFK